MANTKKTALQKVVESSENLNKVLTELSDIDEVLKLSTNDRVKAKMIAFQRRSTEDVIYLENKIRGVIAREAKLEKLIENAKVLLS